MGMYEMIRLASIYGGTSAYIEGYCEGMWIVPGFLSSGDNCVSYGLKASIPMKNLKCSLTGRTKQKSNHFFSKLPYRRNRCLQQQVRDDGYTSNVRITGIVIFHILYEIDDLDNLMRLTYRYDPAKSITHICL